MKKSKRLIISILVTLVSAFILFYVFLPPINIHCVSFWIFLIVILTIFGIMNFGTGIFSLKSKEFDLKNKRNY